MSAAEKLQLEVLFSAFDKVTAPLKGIQQGSNQTAQALKAAKDQLKGLNDQQGRIDAFRKTAKDIAVHNNMLGQAEGKLRTIKEAMAAAEYPTKQMQVAFNEARKEANELKIKVGSLTEKQQRLRTELTGAGIDTKKLSAAQQDLRQRTAAAALVVDKETAALGRQKEQMQRLAAAKAQYDKTMNTRNKLAGAGASAMAAGTAVNAAMAAPVIAYANAEDSAAQLKVSLMSSGGKISEQFKEINALAERLGNRLPGTTSDFQDMMTMLIRQGMPAKAILGGLGEATAYLAVQLKMAPTAAAEFASKLQDATHTTDKDMMGLMDTIQKTFYLGVDQNNMLDGFSKLSPALSVLKKEGLDAAKALAPLLVMTDQAGMHGEAAGNAFRKIFQQGMDARKVAKGNAALAGTGVKLDFTDGKGEFGGLDKMYQQLEQLKGVNTQQRLGALKKIFGDDAETLQALTIMIDKGAAGYKEVQAKMANQANIQERVNLQLGTLKNLWDAASGTFTNAMVAFGESIAPELHATATALGNMAEATQRWAKENPMMAHGLMTVIKYVGLFLIVGGGLLVAIAAVLGPLAMMKLMLAQFGGAAAIFGGGFNLIMKSIGGVGNAVIWLGRMAMANPILALITAIAIGALLIWANWDSIKAKFSGLMNWFTGMWSALKSFFSTGSLEIGKYIIQGLEAGLDALTDGLYSKIKSIAGGLVDAAKSALGIKSPSRVFSEIGGHTMAGLDMGLTGGKDGPLSTVQQTVKKLTAAGAGLMIGGAAMAMPNLDTRGPLNAGQGGAAGGNTYMINVYPQGPASGSPDEIAKAVQQAIMQIEAQRQASQRSSLRDKD